MEQKKILWIVSILMAFLLIVFAVAWFFYSPARRKNNTTVTKLEETQNSLPALAKVDSDAWAKNEDVVPKPDAENPPAVRIDNKVTVVTASEDAIDVKSLVNDEKKVEGDLPASISNNFIAEVSTNENKKTDTVENVEAKNTENKNSYTTSKVQTKVENNKELKNSKTVTKSKSTSATKATTKSISEKKPKTKKPVTKKETTRVYWVQTASLTSRLYAEEARKSLQDKNLKAEIFTKETLQGLTHRVRVGPFANKTEANYWLGSIKKISGFEDSFVSEEKVN